MGTRTIIKVENFNVACLYKHWDGDPESTLPWLEAFNQRFTEKRGADNTYKFAQLIRSSSRDAKEFSLDDSTETGWGFTQLTQALDRNMSTFLWKTELLKLKKCNKFG